MSLQTRPIPPIPHLTAKVARRAFRKGNVYMQMRDALGTFFTDDQFTDLYPADGQPAYAPWRLALVSILQFAENLSDRQAAATDRERACAIGGSDMNVKRGLPWHGVVNCYAGECNCGRGRGPGRRSRVAANGVSIRIQNLFPVVRLIPRAAIAAPVKFIEPEQLPIAGSR